MREAPIACSMAAEWVGILFFLWYDSLVRVTRLFTFMSFECVLLKKRTKTGGFHPASGTRAFLGERSLEYFRFKGVTVWFQNQKRVANDPELTVSTQRISQTALIHDISMT